MLRCYTGINSHLFPFVSVTFFDIAGNVFFFLLFLVSTISGYRIKKKGGEGLHRGWFLSKFFQYSEQMKSLIFKKSGSSLNRGSDPCRVLE